MARAKEREKDESCRIALELYVLVNAFVAPNHSNQQSVLNVLKIKYFYFILFC